MYAYTYIDTYSILIYKNDILLIKKIGIHNTFIILP